MSLNMESVIPPKRWYSPTKIHGFIALTLSPCARESQIGTSYGQTKYFISFRNMKMKNFNLWWRQIQYPSNISLLRSLRDPKTRWWLTLWLVRLWHGLVW